MRKFALGVGVLVGIACGTPSHPPGLSEYAPMSEAGTGTGPLNLMPIVSPNDDPTTANQIELAYGGNLARLRGAKQRFDPHSLFSATPLSLLRTKRSSS